ncbi:MAG: hypothetical protein LBD30_06735 [Verrucomicrobiales bacterium]|jgi:hypothetical protein|nr:hypothetical protein [Verrucomicrobiales bacterium]
MAIKLQEIETESVGEKDTNSRGWKLCIEFGFRPDDVDGFQFCEAKDAGEITIPALTRVFFKGYTTEVPDEEKVLFEFLKTEKNLNHYEPDIV